MKALHTTTTVGPNGEFRLSLTTDELSNVEVDVFVFVQPRRDAEPKQNKPWRDVLRDTCGKWEGDEDLIRPDQGKFEVRDPIE